MHPERLLLVEDDAELRDLFSRILRRRSISHAVAADVPGAMTALGEGAFAVVLLDKHLGANSGYEVLAHIRAEPVHRRSRVILISGEPEDHAPDAQAVDRYLMKPVGVIELLDAVTAELAAFDQQA